MPEKWILHDKALPEAYDKKYRLLSVDASGIKLSYEGLDNFILLPELEELHLCNNNLDDFACDKIARIFRNCDRLEYLDLSDNKISHRGVEGLYQIRSLKKLIIKNTKASQFEFIELLVSLFEDILPQCQIV